MIEFMRRHRYPVDKYMVIRTRINNERVKIENRKAKHFKRLKFD